MQSIYHNVEFQHSVCLGSKQLKRTPGSCADLGEERLVAGACPSSGHGTRNQPVCHGMRITRRTLRQHAGTIAVTRVLEPHIDVDRSHTDRTYLVRQAQLLARELRATAEQSGHQAATQISASSCYP